MKLPVAFMALAAALAHVCAPGQDNPSGPFLLSSPAMTNGGPLPKEFTGDGAAVTPPLEWSGVPDGTRSFALIMHHIDPEGTIKWYWILYNIPATARSLPRDVQGVGILGNNSINGRMAYAPPHSKGPGPKTYIFTLYALSALPQIAVAPAEVSREVLLAAIRDKILAQAELSAVYTRQVGKDGVEPASASRPNFVFVLGEGHGWSSTSVQMDDAVPESKSTFVHTPSLEKLAADGMRFADFYAPSPRCTPSRAALLTGKSPAQLHMTFVNEGRRDSGSDANARVLTPSAGTELPADEVTTAELLKRAGYATAHFGKWHLGRASPSQHGFDENDGPNGNGGPDDVANPHPKQLYAMTDRGLDFMTRQVKAGKPFFLQLSHYASRQGGDASPQALAAVKSWAGHLTERETADAAADLDLDMALGMVLRKLDELGIAANTYVLFTTDHGSPGRNLPLAGGKGTVWEGGLRVPFIIRGPGIQPGVCSHVRAFGEDLYPTIAELAHAREPLPRGVEGGSLASVLARAGKGRVQRPREEFVVHFPHYDKDAIGPASTIYVGNLKLIRAYETGALKLFDLAKDPGERHDLAPQMPDKVSELSQRLTNYLLAVNAQMPRPNPSYDATKPTVGRRGGKQKATP